MDTGEAQDPVCQESWVFVMRLIGQGSYLIHNGREVSLVDISALMLLIGTLLKGNHHD
jgi:hypothetical protein